MKKYFGNYLGIVISRKDTESRGRLKVYIPHIMPVLNANLLKFFGVQGEEVISFNAVGGNVNGGIPEPARAYLENILPYAEPASPIIGSSSPGVKTFIGNLIQNAFGAGSVDKSALVPGNAGVVSLPTTSKIISPTTPIIPVAPSSTPITPSTTPTVSTTSTTPPKPVENNIIPTTTNTYNQFYKVKGTTFGYQDPDDNGLGAWGRNTNNTTLIGVSLNAAASGPSKPEDGITSVLFGSASAAKNKLVEVYNPATGKSFIGPIVDKGPLYSLPNGIDLTAGASIALGGTAKGSFSQGVYYRVLTAAEQTQYSNLVGNDSIGGQAMTAPVGDISIFSDALFGLTNQKATENLKSLVSGTPPPYPPSPTTNKTPAGKQTMTTTNISPTPYDTTNVAKGVFSVPQVGALLWCFFREGNPLFPVYFAASYRSGEWSSIYKSGSPGVNNDTSLEGDQTKSSTTIMPTKGGGVISTEGAGSHEVSMVAYSGGHLKFNENHTILYSPDDFHSQADGNKFDITLSNRETHTKGICNTVVNGDCFEKIGNVTDQSVHDAINKIESLISKINDEMLKPS